MIDVRVCPKCHSVYSVAIEYCGLDGTRLRESDGDPLVGRSIERYRIVQRLGAGGMGCVYRAKHVNLEREFAIKVLFGEMAADQTIAERFRREARSVSAMRHPNIVSVMDFGTAPDGLTFLAMELIEGETLSAYMKRSGPLKPSTAARLCRQIASGLGEAHGLGFVHRDLKPGNVMLEGSAGREQVKILDFGLVTIAAGRGTDTRLTRTGMMFGTPRYMAPEQAEGKEVGPAADLYALGVILYEMLAGRSPFEGTVQELLVRKMSTEAPPLASAAGLERLAMRLVRRLPSERPQDAAEVCAEVDRLGLVRTVSVTCPGEPAPSVSEALPADGEVAAPPEAHDDPRFTRPTTEATPMAEPLLAGPVGLLGSAAEESAREANSGADSPRTIPRIESATVPPLHRGARSARWSALVGGVCLAVVVAFWLGRNTDDGVDVSPLGAVSAFPLPAEQESLPDYPATSTGADAPPVAPPGAAEMPKEAAGKTTVDSEPAQGASNGRAARHTRSAPAAQRRARRTLRDRNEKGPRAPAAGVSSEAETAYRRLRARLEGLESKLAGASVSLGRDEHLRLEGRYSELSMSVVEGLSADAYSRLANEVGDLEKRLRATAK